ncbi:MAG TPA: cation transporter dimerization domain-containing protein [Chthoniobacterales bacterium]|nr:cation transporter dimerization domain-containing protein [Chthoniobacterales bacterium]
MNGVRLLWPPVHEIMDTAPRRGIRDTIRNAAAAVEGVSEVEKCLIRKIGLHSYVDLHVGVDGAISVRAGHEIASGETCGSGERSEDR